MGAYSFFGLKVRGFVQNRQSINEIFAAIKKS
jgi:hypothetical protein